MSNEGGFFNIQDIIEGVNASELSEDTIIAAGAKVICTCATGCSSDSKMIKGASCLLLQKSVELGHKDILFAPPFSACAVGDHVCCPQIEKNEWQDYDETKFTSTGDYSLLKDKSYLLCTKGFGIIYATDNGQKIDQRQAQSSAILFQRWQDNPKEMGYLKGINSCFAYSKDPVNINTGNFIYEHEDFCINGVMPLIFKRFYNAMDTHTSCLGDGWMHNYDMHIKIEKNKIRLYLADGKEEQYRQTSPGIYRNCHNGIGTIQLLRRGSEDSYLYTTANQEKHLFSQDGRELRREDVHGNRITFEYNLDNQLILVDNGCATLFFHYDEKGRLITVLDHTGRENQFEYGDIGIEKVIDAAGNEIQYLYNSQRKIESVTNARGILTVKNEYDQYLRTTTQHFPDGGKMTYVYHDQEMFVEMIEQNGNCVKHYYDDQYRNVKTVYEDGQELFTYNQQNNKIRYKDKRGYLTRYEYDSRGNEIKQIDPLGNRVDKGYDQQNRLLSISINGITKLSNQYDQRGNLIKSTDGIGRSREFAYNQQGLPVEFRQPDGGRYKFEYDQQGHLTKIIDSESFYLGYQYDQLNRIIATIDANGNKLQYHYDCRNNLLAVVQEDGKKQSYTYNENSKLTSISDDRGSNIVQEYGVLNKPNKIIDANGNQTLLEYDQMWNLSQLTDANGGVTKYTYNRANQLECVTNALGGRICYEYDPNGNLTKIIGYHGEVTELDYNALNQVTQCKEPNEALHCYEYNAAGQVIKYIDPNGQTTQYEYDNAGQKIKEINALNEETHYTYNELSQITQIRKEDHILVDCKYDRRGLLIKEQHIDGTLVHYIYDGNQNLIEKADQKGYALHYQYDRYDRIIRISSNQGQENSYDYDAMGNLTEMMDANGHKTRYIYDPAGYLIGVIDPEGNQTVYHYDLVGNLTHIVQGDGQLFPSDCQLFSVQELLTLNKQNNKLRTTQYQHNLSGQIVQIIDPMGNTENYSYDCAGNLITKKDNDGHLTAYQYNASGDVSKINYDDQREVLFSYNPVRQLIQFEDWLGITRIERDELGRITKVVDHQEREVGYQWGRLNERRGIAYPDGRTVTYEYDDHLRLKKVNDISSSMACFYDNQGHLKEKDYLNGIKTTYSYDLLGRISCLTHRDRIGIMDEYQYRYDAVGNKTAVKKYRNGLNQESGSYQYQYDSLNRLKNVSKDSEQLRSYSYDPYGNRIQSVNRNKRSKYIYNQLNQLISKADTWLDSSLDAVKEESYQYDRRGNLIAIYQSNLLVNEYFYGSTNQLEQTINLKSGIGANYSYNGLGNRIKKTEGILEKTVSLLDPSERIKISPTKIIDDVLDQTKQSENLLQRHENDQKMSFIWDNHGLNSSQIDSEYNLYLLDELKSPIRLVHANKSGHENYGYDEFGNNLYLNQNSTQPFGFTLYQPDIVAGTNYAQAREYHSVQGRFVSQDMVKGMIKAPFTMNSYTYCFNQPLAFIDATGAWPSLSEIGTSVVDFWKTKIYGERTINETISASSMEGLGGVYVKSSISTTAKSKTNTGSFIIKTSTIKADPAKSSVGYSLNLPTKNLGAGKSIGLPIRLGATFDKDSFKINASVGLDLIKPKIRVDANVGVGRWGPMINADANAGFGWLNDMVGIGAGVPTSPFESLKVLVYHRSFRGNDIIYTEAGAHLKMGVAYAIAVAVLAPQTIPALIPAASASCM